MRMAGISLFARIAEPCILIRPDGCVPGLHDVRKSGWRAVGFPLGEFALLAMSFTMLPLKNANDPDGALHPDRRWPDDLAGNDAR